MKLRPFSLARGFAPLTACAALTGCFAIGSQEITVVEPPPLAFQVDDDNVTLTEGTSLVARIAVLDEEQYLIDPAEIQWTVSTPNASITTTATAGVYVITGIRAGTAVLDGARSGAGGDAVIHVTVTAQPPL
ncbi:MAG: hypothetical protein U0414_28415 [Polyangiaceae bacterium]